MKRIHPALWLIAAVAVVYAQTLAFGFVALDDSKHIWSNPYVRHLSWDNFWFFWTQPYYGLFIPVVYNAWTILATLTESLGWAHPITEIKAPLFHGANVITHILNSLMVAALLTFLLARLSEPAKKKATPPADPSPLAWTLAAIYALHPLQVEAVAWVSGLKDTLATLFALVASLLFLSSHERRQDLATLPHFILQRLGRYSLGQRQWAAALFFALALASKPMVVVLPLALTLVAAVFLKQNWRKTTTALSLWWILAAATMWLTKSQQPDSQLDFEYGFAQRPLIALFSLGFYLFKFFAPIGLSPDYGFSPPVAMARPEFWWLVALGGAAIVTPAILWWRGLKPVSAALIIIPIGLAPVLGLVPFEFQKMSTVADRYFYFLPMLGILLAIAVSLRNREAWRWAALGAATLCLGLSFVQTRHWRSNDALFAHVLDWNPQSYLAYSNLGLEAMRTQDYDRSVDLFKKALEAKPDYLTAQSNLGAVYFKQKKYPLVIQHYQSVLAQHPEPGVGSPALFADIYFNLAAAQLNSGQLDASLKNMKKAVEINPNHFLAHFQMGRILDHLGRTQDALQSWNQALRLSPNDPRVIREIQSAQRGRQ